MTGPTDPDLTGTLNHNTGVVSQGPGNATQDLSKTYEGDAEILRLVTNVYYIGRRNNDPNNPPGLFRKELDDGVVVTEELVSGVDNMQVFYGEDSNSDGTADVYRTADQVVDWSIVVTARLGLLVRTLNYANSEVDTRVYGVLGTLIGPYNDRQQRRVFTTTVELRN